MVGRTVRERYITAWGGESGSCGTSDIQRGTWRLTQHAAVLDAVDLFWREPHIEQVDIFCEADRISTLHRSHPRISATLAALEHAVRDIYEEDSA
jgi:hypothetical protein